MRETIDKVIFARCKRTNRKVRKVILRCLDDWFLQQLTSGCVRGAFLQKDKIVDDKMTMFPILVSSTAAGLLVTGLSVPEDNSQLFPVKVFFRPTHPYITSQLNFAYFILTVQEAQQFLVEPSDQVVKLGEDFVLQCIVENKRGECR